MKNPIYLASRFEFLRIVLIHSNDTLLDRDQSGLIRLLTGIIFFEKIVKRY